MAVHHDKAIYGKLSRLQKELCEDEIDNVVAAINALSLEEHAVKENIKEVEDKNFSDKKSNRNKIEN